MSITFLLLLSEAVLRYEHNWLTLLLLSVIGIFMRNMILVLIVLSLKNRYVLGYTISSVYALIVHGDTKIKRKYC